MAQINLSKIIKIEKQHNKIHDKVFSTYSTYEYGGDKFVQIDTYGKDDREIPGKTSQSFQFDRETAKFIVNLFTQEFNLK